MGLSIIPYLVEVTGLRQLFGCHDAVVRNDLLGVLREDSRWDEESVEQAIGDLVMGVTSTLQEPRDYAAALEILCLYRGERLPVDALSSMHPPATALLDSLPGLLNDIPLPVPLPGPRSRGFPTPLFITSENAQINLALLEDLEASIEDEEASDWLAAAANEYRSWLLRAVTDNKELLLFLQ